MILLALALSVIVQAGKYQFDPYEFLESKRLVGVGTAVIDGTECPALVVEDSEAVYVAIFSPTNGKCLLAIRSTRKSDGEHQYIWVRPKGQPLDDKVQG
jgi:hypothetical protein